MVARGTEADASDTEAGALSKARRATAAEQLHRNNCSMQPGRSMHTPPAVARAPSPTPLQVTAAGRHDSAREYQLTFFHPAVASTARMSMNLGPSDASQGKEAHTEEKGG